MKKIYRTTTKLFLYYFLRVIKFLLNKSNYKIIPAISDYDRLNFDYSKNTRRLVLKKEKKSFDKIIIDSTHSETDLCFLGKKYSTNKSSLNLDGHRSGYTSLYSLLFSSLKEKKCLVAEIGIEKNGSTNMWRNYFSKARIECFEVDKKKIEFAKKQKLKKVHYHYIDVDSPSIITKQFNKVNKKFDIIIDDSTHEFNHQINIIKNTHRFIKSGGYLVIEDIYRFRKGYEESRYYEKLKYLKKIFSKIVFIETIHANNFTASWKCEKILLLIKK
ncbi:class I SAM-dependent methyltransferase [Pelagibacteraceae bacterium]|jgi:spermidine synthase|nr:class I SAM-dependent methyltransferase [Pelagibacteraceae bacterium]